MSFISMGINSTKHMFAFVTVQSNGFWPMQWEAYLFCKPHSAAPPACAGAQHHTQQVSEQFYVVVTYRLFCVLMNAIFIPEQIKKIS
jgi:hypothetical protein